MYAVIFTAEIKTLDTMYADVAEQMRELAKSRYGCREFNSVTEGNREIAISYWDTLEQISRWKQDPDHRSAQEAGRKKWYRSYRVQVVKLVREYEVNP